MVKSGNHQKRFTQESLAQRQTAPSQNFLAISEAYQQEMMRPKAVEWGVVGSDQSKKQAYRSQNPRVELNPFQVQVPVEEKTNLSLIQKPKNSKV